MRKRWAALLAVATMVLAMAATTGTALASTTDACLEVGPGPVGAQSCFATTSEDNVDFGTVNMGRYSAGSFTLVCEEYGDVFVKQGNIGQNGTRTFFTEGLFGLRNPDCTLSARAHNVVKNRSARVRVTLID